MNEQEPLSKLISDNGLATALGISRSMVHKLRSAGQLPAPIRLGRCLRWDSSLIEDWIADGCPNPERWERGSHDS